MWFFCFVIACIVIAMLGVVIPKLFWWSIIGTSVLWALGVVVEMLWIPTDSRPASRIRRQGLEQAPPNGRNAEP